MEKPSEQVAKWQKEDRPIGVHYFPVFDVLDQLWEEVERLKREREEVREASDSLDLKV